MPETGASGVTIRYDDLGRGEPAILCLPGWCAPRTAFSELAAALSPRHRVLNLDWRGHGESAEPGTDFGSEALVEDALAVIAASGAKRVVPLATAHAGWVAIELRRRLGDRIAKIVLIDWLVLDPPPPFLDALRAMQDPRTSKPTVDALFDMWLTGSEDRTVIDFVRKEMGAFGFDMWARAAREISAAYAAEGNPLTALAGLQPPPPVLHIFALPKDEAFLTAQQSFAREHPWFQVRRLDTLTHFPTLEAPSIVARAVEEFL
ncbi:MAG: alpha/beta fold hydrolase [Candidatus Binatia bacterium]